MLEVRDLGELAALGLLLAVVFPVVGESPGSDVVEEDLEGLFDFRVDASDGDAGDRGRTDGRCDRLRELSDGGGRGATTVVPGKWFWIDAWASKGPTAG